MLPCPHTKAGSSIMSSRKLQVLNMTHIQAYQTFHLSAFTTPTSFHHHCKHSVEVVGCCWPMAKPKRRIGLSDKKPLVLHAYRALVRGNPHPCPSGIPHPHWTFHPLTKECGEREGRVLGGPGAAEVVVVVWVGDREGYKDKDTRKE